ncbi:putative CorA family metal ion transporter [Paraphaeosphaeria sporulosa]
MSSLLEACDLYADDENQALICRVCKYALATAGSRVTTHLDKKHSVEKQSQITVVDFPVDRIEKHELSNSTLANFLAKPREDWVTCRWYPVNGFSWDAVRLIRERQKLHGLAVEDLLHTRNRTKADWYPEPVFILLTLQRLIRTSESTTGSSVSRAKHVNIHSPASRDIQVSAEYKESVRTLQAFRHDVGDERTKYMEENSSLASKGLMMFVEQVSIFLQSDNTLVSFLEHSADAIEELVLKRLQSSETVLRRSGDASMVMHAIIDGTVDFAIPIATAYEEHSRAGAGSFDGTIHRSLDSPVHPSLPKDVTSSRTTDGTQQYYYVRTLTATVPERSDLGYGECTAITQL